MFQNLLHGLGANETLYGWLAVPDLDGPHHKDAASLETAVNLLLQNSDLSW